ncbi:MAG: hypothetical protein HQL46_13755 [Gammaproteobacteria bacterium]|nr:hypothetical protein [Gammaproteobacteria bacterium]
MRLPDWIMSFISLFVVFIGMNIFNNPLLNIFDIVSVQVGESHKLIGTICFLIGLWMLYTIYRWQLDLKQLRKKNVQKVKTYH